MGSIKYDLKRQALGGISNDRVVKQYKREIEDFSEWAKKSYKIRRTEDIAKQGLTPQELIQSYSDHLQKKGKDFKHKGKSRPLSAASIHTYLAPICKGLQINMDLIQKPIRSASEITKSRDPSTNLRGKRAMEKPEAQRIIKAQKAIGIRKRELIKLRGRNLTYDVNLNLCVEVEKGKGGKRQLQRILPADELFVVQLFQDKDHAQKVFTLKEIKVVKEVDLHGLRAAHARECYEFYVKEIDAGNEEPLKKELINSFNTYHKRDPRDPQRFDRQLKKFISDIEKDGGMYHLRGENRKRALQAGKPTSYNRLSLMCVSVWHLSHWRTDVTIKNYML